jgi:hypothetical protein
MKRFAALAVLALGVLFSIPAHATGPALPWKWETINFRKTGANGFGVDLVLPPDSSFIIRGGSTAVQTTYDTTAAFPLSRAQLPEYARPFSTGVDSLTWFAFKFSPTPLQHISGVTTATFDSLLVQAQVSLDGRTWTDVTPNHNFDVSRPTGLANGDILVEPASTANGIIKVFKQVVNAAGQNLSSFLTATAPDDKTLWGWKYVRFIVTDCGEIGDFTAEIGFWSNEDINSKNQ